MLTRGKSLDGPVYCPADRLASAASADRSLFQTHPRFSPRRTSVADPSPIPQLQRACTCRPGTARFGVEVRRRAHTDQTAPHVSPRALEIHRRAFVFDAHVHALDREFYNGGSMGEQIGRTDSGILSRAREGGEGAFFLSVYVPEEYYPQPLRDQADVSPNRSRSPATGGESQFG